MLQGRTVSACFFSPPGMRPRQLVRAFSVFASLCQIASEGQIRCGSHSKERRATLTREMNLEPEPDSRTKLNTNTNQPRSPTQLYAKC